MGNRDNFANGVVSVQLRVQHEGKDCHVLITDPKTPEGFSWIGGFFRPTGSFHSTIEELVREQTGAEIDKSSVRLKRIVYSRTALNNRWIANHAFFVDASTPIYEWSKPKADFGVSLFETSSFAMGESPKKFLDVQGNTPQKFAWSINDGRYIGRNVACNFSHLETKGKEAFPDIPFVDIPVYENRMPPGWGLHVGSVIIPHTYKGKRGRVVIKNRDSEHYANVGGKVEVLIDKSSDNIDVLSCIRTEASEEIGLGLTLSSVVGVSHTPLDLVLGDKNLASRTKAGDMTSVMNTCVRATPMNPEQLDEAIEHPERYIPEREREKIKGIYFLPNNDYVSLCLDGEMRTPDMPFLSRQEYEGVPSDRTPLEIVDVLPKTEHSSRFRGVVLDEGGRSKAPETTIV